MVWDKTRPLGSKKLNISDEDLRENAAAIEAAINLEHEFVTGDTQRGIHKFSVGDDSDRDTWFAPEGEIEGAIWFNDDRDSGHGWLVLQRYNGATWDDIGVYEPNIARIDEAKVWAKGQAGAWVAFTESGVGPYDWDWNLDDGNFFYETIPDTGAVTIKAPTVTGLVDDANGSTIMFKVQQAPGTAGTLAFDSEFSPAGGFQPPISTTLDTVHLISVVMLASNSFVYTVTEL